MIATSEWKPTETNADRYEAHSESGHCVVLDADDAHGDGPSPVEAVLMALCSCTSVDVVSILKKKRQPITSLEVVAKGERQENPPRYFHHIHLMYRIGGRVSRKAAEDAVALSKNKYCSVSAMLDGKAMINAAIEFVDGEPLS
uniref:OsmC-like protein n=1 Tax=mine drainage metagenome TaxID=410659 RepID=E6PZ08_9ZZZZ